MFQYFSFFFWAKETKLKKKQKQIMKNEKLIEEEPEIRKTNYVKIFLEADKRKNNKKGFKNPSYKNKQRKHYSEKNIQKKEIGKKTFVRQESREDIFPCF